MTEVGIYVHVPFCVQKCLYCDFNSYAGRDSLRGAYVEALGREVTKAATAAARAGRGLVASSLYLGGGTPSLLSAEEVEAILEACRKHLGWSSSLETTMEANPGTIDRARASRLRRLGINRVSLGVQSLDDSMLRRLGRIHSAVEALDAYEALRVAGFENVNIDLMYALPGQSLLHWEDTLNAAVVLAPEHFSLYPLTIEDGTPFSRLLGEGRLVVPGEDQAADMYESACRIMEDAGYEQYELSNWARGGGRHRCRHNVIYWTNRPYLGFGAGAHSYAQGRRFSDVLDPAEYISRLRKGDSPREHEEEIGIELEMKETVILGLRLVEGLARSEFARRFSRGLDDVFGPIVERLMADGLLVSSGDRIALTDRGRLLANEAFVAFLSCGNVRKGSF